jgi:type II secretory pathway pseudopilin PulG
MNTRNRNLVWVNPSARRTVQGQTLIEIMVAAGLLGLMIVSLYVGFVSGFTVVRAARENQRATQILEERMEVLRLVRWQDVAPGFIPTTFAAPFYAGDPTNNSGAGLVYTGTVTITNAPVTESYANALKMIRIDLTWASGNVTHQRQMTTFVSRYGVQNYIY